MTPTRPLFVAAAAALSLCAASAAHAASQTGPRAAQACFRPSEVTGWRAVGTKGVNIQINNRDLYRLNFTYPCDALSFAGERIGFDKTGAGPVCSGVMVDVVVRGMSCPVASIRHLRMSRTPASQRP